MVNCSLVATLPDICINQIFSNKLLIRNLGNQHLACLKETDNIINVRTVVYRLNLTQAITNKALFVIYKKLLICNNNLRSTNVFKYFYFCFTLFPFAEVLLKVPKVLYRILNEIC